MTVTADGVADVILHEAESRDLGGFRLFGASHRSGPAGLQLVSPPHLRQPAVASTRDVLVIQPQTLPQPE